MSIILETKDNKRKIKIKQIKGIVGINRKGLPNILEHEVLFTQDIKLKDILVGVLCEKEFTKKIKKMLVTNGFNNVGVYDLHKGMPELINLLKECT